MTWVCVCVVGARCVLQLMSVLLTELICKKDVEYIID